MFLLIFFRLRLFVQILLYIVELALGVTSKGNIHFSTYLTSVRTGWVRINNSLVPVLFIYWCIKMYIDGDIIIIIIIIIIIGFLFWVGFTLVMLILRWLRWYFVGCYPLAKCL